MRRMTATLIRSIAKKNFSIAAETLKKLPLEQQEDIRSEMRDYLAEQEAKIREEKRNNSYKGF